MPRHLSRRALLVSTLALLPAMASAESTDCGCAGPKSLPQNRAEQLYRMALKSADSNRRRELAERALSIWPEHEGARDLLAELDG